MTVSNEEILYELRELVALERKRHQTIMAILNDVKGEVATLVANTKTMLAELTATGAAGHAAVLDDVQATIKSAAAEIATEIQGVKGKLPGMTLPPVA